MLTEDTQSEEHRLLEEESLHSENMQDIIGAPPKWLYKWGISIIMGVLLLCIGMSFFISYPDVVHLSLRVRSSAPTTPVVCADSGRLIKALVDNDQLVYRGQNVAYINSNNLKLIIKAPVAGKIVYAGIIHENMLLKPRQQIFYIVGNGSSFFGEMEITPNYIGKIKPGQNALISIRNASDYQYLNGTIKYITEDTTKRGQHIAEVDFIQITKKTTWLKEGQIAETSILTSKATVFDRLIRSVINKL